VSTGRSVAVAFDRPATFLETGLPADATREPGLAPAQPYAGVSRFLIARSFGVSITSPTMALDLRGPA
jgi:hypothetical protein